MPYFRRPGHIYHIIWLDDWHRSEVLNQITADFTMSLDVPLLLPLLAAHQLLTKEETNSLLSQFIPSAKKAELILLYLNRKDKDAFLKLLCCLNQEQEHFQHKILAAKLQKLLKLERFISKLHCPVCKTCLPAAKPENGN